jgi:hypothetical protein
VIFIEGKTLSVSPKLLCAKKFEMKICASETLLAITCNATLEGVLEAAGHTNTMMWIGRMDHCPIDLSSQVP